jgi:hypothetical protein
MKFVAVLLPAAIAIGCGSGIPGLGARDGGDDSGSDRADAAFDVGGLTDVASWDAGCRGYGEMLDVPAATCCDGLSGFRQLVLIDDFCEPVNRTGALTCGRCGDGICDPALENICSCGDCQADSG